MTESFGEFAERVASETAATVRAGRWGKWTLDRDKLDLNHDNGGTWAFPLTECNTSGQVLYFLAQANKTWVSNEDYGDLIRAVILLLDPQRTLCAVGAQTKIDDVPVFLRARLAELESA